MSEDMSAMDIVVKAFTETNTLRKRLFEMATAILQADPSGYKAEDVLLQARLDIVKPDPYTKLAALNAYAAAVPHAPTAVLLTDAKSILNIAASRVEGTVGNYQEIATAATEAFRAVKNYRPNHIEALWKLKNAERSETEHLTDKAYHLDQELRVIAEMRPDLAFAAAANESAKLESVVLRLPDDASSAVTAPVPNQLQSFTPVMIEQQLALPPIGNYISHEPVTLCPPYLLPLSPDKDGSDAIAETNRRGTIGQITGYKAAGVVTGTAALATASAIGFKAANEIAHHGAVSFTLPELVVACASVACSQIAKLFFAEAKKQTARLAQDNATQQAVMNSAQPSALVQPKDKALPPPKIGG